MTTQPDLYEEPDVLWYCPRCPYTCRQPPWVTHVEHPGAVTPHVMRRTPPDGQDTRPAGRRSVGRHPSQPATERTHATTV